MVTLPDGFGNEVVEMARQKRPLTGGETKVDEGFSQMDRDIIGPPLRIEIPFAVISVYKLREIAKDMIAAWQEIEALTRHEDLTKGRNFGKEARHVMMEAKHRLKSISNKHLPSRKAGRLR